MISFLIAAARSGFVSKSFSNGAVASIAGLLLIGGLSSCSTTAYPVTPDLAKARGLKAGQGYIVGTFNVKSMTDSGGKIEKSPDVKVFAQGTGKNRTSSAILTPTVSPGGGNAVWSGGATSREVIAIPVAAGDYEITLWNVSEGSLYFRNRLPMKVPFQVRPGEATYVGRVNSLNLYSTSNGLLGGVQVLGAAAVLITDEYATDSARIARSYPNIGRDKIHRSNVPKVYREEVERISETPRKWLEWLR